MSAMLTSFVHRVRVFRRSRDRAITLNQPAVMGLPGGAWRARAACSSLHERIRELDSDAGHGGHSQERDLVCTDVAADGRCSPTAVRAPCVTCIHDQRCTLGLRRCAPEDEAQDDAQHVVRKQHSGPTAAGRGAVIKTHGLERCWGWWWRRMMLRGLLLDQSCRLVPVAALATHEHTAREVCAPAGSAVLDLHLYGRFTDDSANLTQHDVGGGLVATSLARPCRVSTHADCPMFAQMHPFHLCGQTPSDETELRSS